MSAIKNQKSKIENQPCITRFVAQDGYPIAVRIWDQPAPVARVIFTHGIISHGGWYLNSCRHLAGAGFEVHFVDRRGSGMNTQARGDVDRFETWLDDLEGYLASLPNDAPKLLLGISWGGKLVAAVARHRPELVTAIGLLCPGLFSASYPSAIKFTALRLAARMGLGGMRVPIPLRQPEVFTNSASWGEYIKSDPLTLRTVTIRFALADRRHTRYATEDPRAIQLPTLLMLAGRDRIVDNRRVGEFYERIGGGQKTMIEYPEAAHTLEFEPDPLPYFEDLSRWAQEVVGG